MRAAFWPIKIARARSVVHADDRGGCSRACLRGTAPAAACVPPRHAARTASPDVRCARRSDAPQYLAKGYTQSVEIESASYTSTQVASQRDSGSTPWAATARRSAG